ncbi:MAG TPA: TetR/AcrR family transcriptional regulator [Gemmatimonadaceae bacterium]|nr:TetR/AcrR family transcriptional regulator [Gemmatimonadaceae bacterium]
MPRAAAPAKHAPRFRRLPEERPGQILDAALIEFGEKGLAHARLDDVARRAGVAKGTIYLYFPTKHDLFRAMVRHLATRALADFELRADAGDGSVARDQLHRYVEGLWAHVRGPIFDTLHRLTTGELPEFPELMRFFVQETAEKALRICAGIIRRGVAAREFRRVDPDTTARMIHAIVIKHGVWCAHRPQVPFVARTTDAQVLREMLDFIDHALLAGPPRPARRPARRPRAARR